MDIAKSEKITALLERMKRLLPDDTGLALVIILPPAATGFQAAHTVAAGMDADAFEFAAECLLNNESGKPLLRQVH